MPDQAVLVAILAFAGVLISALIGSKAQKIMDRRNNKNYGHNPGPSQAIVCPLDGASATIVALTAELRGVKEELVGVRTGQSSLATQLSGMASDIKVLKDRGQR